MGRAGAEEPLIQPGPYLFDPRAHVLRPTGTARIAAMARRPWRGRTVAERKAEEDRSVIERLRAQGSELAAAFGLRFAAIEAERDGVNAHYGICYSDGRIRIRLRHAVTGRLLKESSLVDTLCHELAHLRHFDHSSRFRAFYQRVLEAARRSGYYRPGPAKDRPACQPSLFEIG